MSYTDIPKKDRLEIIEALGREIIGLHQSGDATAKLEAHRKETELSRVYCRGGLGNEKDVVEAYMKIKSAIHNVKQGMPPEGPPVVEGPTPEQKVAEWEHLMATRELTAAERQQYRIDKSLAASRALAESRAKELEEQRAKLKEDAERRAEMSEQIQRGMFG